MNNLAHMYIFINLFIQRSVLLCNGGHVFAMFKKISFGAKIFGTNNYKSLISQQEKIHKQIEGILINVKINIRSQLIEVVIESLKNKEVQKKYAIA